MNIAIQNRLRRFNTVDKENLTQIFKKMKKTHCALDPMPVSDLTGAENISIFLDMILKIINTSIQSCIFPKNEKRAVIHPALKGSLDPQSLNSYRPISNLPFVSKILEYSILDQLLTHLNEVQAIPDNQSAYRQLYSTETTICSVVNDLLIMMDEGKCGLLVLLDLSAAF